MRTSESGQNSSTKMFPKQLLTQRDTARTTKNALKPSRRYNTTTNALSTTAVGKVWVPDHVHHPTSSRAASDTVEEPTKKETRSAEHPRLRKSFSERPQSVGPVLACPGKGLCAGARLQSNVSSSVEFHQPSASRLNWKRPGHRSQNLTAYEFFGTTYCPGLRLYSALSYYGSLQSPRPHRRQAVNRNSNFENRCVSAQIGQSISLQQAS